MFTYTTAIRKLRSLTKRIKVIQGGTWAGKTYSIIPLLIDTATKNPKETITVIAETIPAVKDGAVKIFKDVMQETSRWVEDRWLSNPMQYTFANGTVIQFKSYDTVGKAKASGKRHRLFINEANHHQFDIVDALIMRTEVEVWMDYNPDAEFWAHTEMIPREDAEFCLLTYHDNEACPETILRELEMKQNKAFYNVLGNWDDPRNVKSKYWANWCRVYIQGLTGNLEGLVFQNWEVIDGIPEGADLLGYGTDFGKGGADPTTTTAFFYFDGKIIWDELIYQSQLRDSEHIELLKTYKVDSRKKNYCDNSEPSKIRELQIGGINAVGEKKETIDYGIGLIQERPFAVTSRSLNVIKELRGYKYDDSAKPSEKGKAKGSDHAIDNARYFYVGHFGVAKSTFKPSRVRQ